MRSFMIIHKSEKKRRSSATLWFHSIGSLRVPLFSVSWFSAPAIHHSLDMSRSASDANRSAVVGFVDDDNKSSPTEAD